MYGRIVAMCWDLQLSIKSYVLRFYIREHYVMHIIGLFECFTYVLELEMARIFGQSLIYFNRKSDYLNGEV